MSVWSRCGTDGMPKLACVHCPICCMRVHNTHVCATACYVSMVPVWHRWHA